MDFDVIFNSENMKLVTTLTLAKYTTSYLYESNSNGCLITENFVCPWGKEMPHQQVTLEYLLWAFTLDNTDCLWRKTDFSIGSLCVQPFYENPIMLQNFIKQKKPLSFLDSCYLKTVNSLSVNVKFSYLLCKHMNYCRFQAMTYI